MIRIRGVSKSYGGRLVLDNVDFVVPEGRLTCLLGPNGAGKSTLVDIVGRLEAPDSGTADVGGLDVARANTLLLSRRLAVLRQEHGETIRLTVRDLVGFGRYPYSRGRLTQTDLDHVQGAIDFFRLTGVADSFLDELSGGQRQRAYAAMTLAQDTDHILLDEPLNNLDMEHCVRMMGLLRRLVDEKAKTIVAVLHDLNFAAAYSDHIVVLKDGAVAFAGPPARLMDPQTLRELFGVEAHVVERDGFLYALYHRPARNAGAITEERNPTP